MMIRKPQEQAEEQRLNMRGGDGTVTVRQYFTPEEFGANMRLCARLILPPGSSIGLHQHKGEDEIYLVLSGEGVLQDDNGTHQVKAGDAVLTGKGESHAISNHGNADLEIAAIIILYS